jgi:hypothetical protein
MTIWRPVEIRGAENLQRIPDSQVGAAVGRKIPRVVGISHLHAFALAHIIPNLVQCFA